MFIEHFCTAHKQRSAGADITHTSNVRAVRGVLEYSTHSLALTRESPTAENTLKSTADKTAQEGGKSKFRVSWSRGGIMVLALIAISDKCGKMWSNQERQDRFTVQQIFLMNAFGILEGI